jgi:hypothetical protein
MVTEAGPISKDGSSDPGLVLSPVAPACYPMAMRAAFVMVDALDDDHEVAGELQRLEAAGLQPVILRPEPVEAEATYLGYPQVACPPGNPYCPDDLPDLLMKAAARVDVPLAEAFAVCGDSRSVVSAAKAGCRPVLVLGGQSLEEALGPLEPDDKSFATAMDLSAAVGNMLLEAQQDEALGAFPYGSHRALEERPPLPVFTRSDLHRILAVVIAAGVAIALGIAYLLQELYETYRFPEVAYYLTLQFIPQTWRGVLFLLLGAGGTLLAQRIVNRIIERRRAV